MKQSVINVFFITLGSLIMSLGIIGFLAPNHIFTGGTAGLAMLFNQLFTISIGAWMLIINVPLVMLGSHSIGRKFAFYTIFCILLIAVSTDVFVKVLHIKKLSDNLLLATLYGGVLIGLGLGFVFKGGASAGGATIVAKLLSDKYQLKHGNVILFLDAIIVISAGVFFQNIELALWSLISIFVSTKIIDTIILGVPTQKIVHISSTKNLHELSRLISNQMGISGTIIKGNDLQISEYKDIIFLMVDKARLHELKQLVLGYDADVKMIVMQATEVLGQS